MSMSQKPRFLSDHRSLYKMGSGILFVLLVSVVSVLLVCGVDDSNKHKDHSGFQSLNSSSFHGIRIITDSHEPGAAWRSSVPSFESCAEQCIEASLDCKLAQYDEDAGVCTILNKTGDFNFVVNSRFSIFSPVAKNFTRLPGFRFIGHEISHGNRPLRVYLSHVWTVELCMQLCLVHPNCAIASYESKAEECQLLSAEVQGFPVADNNSHSVFFKWLPLKPRTGASALGEIPTQLFTETTDRSTNPEVLTSGIYGKVKLAVSSSTTEMSTSDMRTPGNMSQSQDARKRQNAGCNIRIRSSPAKFVKEVASENECKQLAEGECHIESPSRCQEGHFAVFCSNRSSRYDIDDFLLKFYWALPCSPIGLTKEGNFGKYDLIFDRHRFEDRIVHLRILRAINLNLGVIQRAELRNLLELVIQDGIGGVTITRANLGGMRSLRILRILNTPIENLEKGALEALPALKQLVLEEGIFVLPIGSPTPVITSSASESGLSSRWISVFKLHCDQEYAWLRKYLDDHPQLTVPRAEGELWRKDDAPGFQRAVDRTTQGISLVVDCGNRTVHGRYHRMPISSPAPDQSSDSVLGRLGGGVTPSPLFSPVPLYPD